MGDQAMCKSTDTGTQETPSPCHIILNITRYAAQVKRQKLNEIIDALQRSNEDLNSLFNKIQRFGYNALDTNRFPSTCAPY